MRKHLSLLAILALSVMFSSFACSPTGDSLVSPSPASLAQPSDDGKVTAQSNGTLNATIWVVNDYLWYSAPDIVTFTVDGVARTVNGGGPYSYDGTVSVSLAPGSHSVSVTFQTGQEYNYVMDADHCSPSKSVTSGGTTTCDVYIIECPNGPGGC